LGLVVRAGRVWRFEIEQSDLYDLDFVQLFLGEAFLCAESLASGESDGAGLFGGVWGLMISSR
jgi:hypothetical protein